MSQYLQFMDHLEPEALEDQIGNTSAVTLRLGTEFKDNAATAATFLESDFRPGPPEAANIRFVFQDVTAWHALSYSAAEEAIAIAQRQVVTYQLAIDWCCAPPVPLRLPPPGAATSTANVGQIAGIVAAVTIAVGTIHQNTSASSVSLQLAWLASGRSLASLLRLVALLVLGLWHNAPFRLA